MFSVGSPIVNSDFIIIPNWLCCACCSSAIARSDEILHDTPTTLTQAVYTYLLEILGEEVPVYSATNTHDHRFDVVRVSLQESLTVPEFPSRHQQRGPDRDMIQLILRRMQGTAVSQHPVDMEAATRILEDLDEMTDFVPDTSGEEPSSPEPDALDRNPRSSRIFAGRLISVGEPTAEFSWFPGYLWTIGTCKVCGEHLGWIFHTADLDIVFQTIIVTKLREKCSSTCDDVTVS